MLGAPARPSPLAASRLMAVLRPPGFVDDDCGDSHSPHQPTTAGSGGTASGPPPRLGRPLGAFGARRNPRPLSPGGHGSLPQSFRSGPLPLPFTACGAASLRSWSSQPGTSSVKRALPPANGSHSPGPFASTITAWRSVGQGAQVLLPGASRQDALEEVPFATRGRGGPREKAQSRSPPPPSTSAPHAGSGGRAPTPVDAEDISSCPNLSSLSGRRGEPENANRPRRDHG